jgi:hypothetical protein
MVSLWFFFVLKKKEEEEKHLSAFLLVFIQSHQ